MGKITNHLKHSQVSAHSPQVPTDSPRLATATRQQRSATGDSTESELPRDGSMGTGYPIKMDIYGWFMDGLWMVYGWFMDGLWMVNGWLMDG